MWLPVDTGTSEGEGMSYEERDEARRALYFLTYATGRETYEPPEAMGRQATQNERRIA